MLSIVCSLLSLTYLFFRYLLAKRLFSMNYCEQCIAYEIDWSTICAVARRPFIHKKLFHVSFLANVLHSWEENSLQGCMFCSNTIVAISAKEGLVTIHEETF